MKKYIVSIMAAVAVVCLITGCSVKKEQQAPNNSQIQSDKQTKTLISFSESKEETFNSEESQSDIVVPSESSEPVQSDSSENNKPDTVDTKPTITENPQAVAPATPESKAEIAATPQPEQSPNPTIPPTPEPIIPTPVPTPEPTPEPFFDVGYWVQYAKNYGTSIGMNLDSSSTGSWDTPIVASSKSIYLERDIKDTLDWYKNDYGYQGFWVWSESLSNGKYNIYISYS